LICLDISVSSVLLLSSSFKITSGLCHSAGTGFSEHFPPPQIYVPLYIWAIQN
jgi:hypothetical protein